MFGGLQQVLDLEGIGPRRDLDGAAGSGRRRIGDRGYGILGIRRVAVLACDVATGTQGKRKRKSETMRTQIGNVRGGELDQSGCEERFSLSHSECDTVRSNFVNISRRIRDKDSDSWCGVFNGISCYRRDPIKVKYVLQYLNHTDIRKWK